MYKLFLGFLSVALFPTLLMAEPIMLKDVTGKFELTAEVQSLVGETVELKTSDGVKKIPLSVFDRESLIKIAVAVWQLSKSKQDSMNSPANNPFSGLENQVPLGAEPESVSALRRYQESNTVSERIPLVVQRPATVSNMKTLYDGNNGRTWDNREIKIYLKSVSEVPVGKTLEVYSEWKGLGSDIVSKNLYYVQNTGKGYKVDWEASLGFNPIPLKTYKANFLGSGTFRLDCQINDYYNYQFRNSRLSHLSIKMKDLHGGGFIYGYISRTTPIGKRIQAILMDGQFHRLTLKLYYVGPDGKLLNDGSSSTNSNIVSITDLVSESWVIPD